MQQAFQKGKKTRRVVVVPKVNQSTVDLVRQDEIWAQHVEPG